MTPGSKSAAEWMKVQFAPDRLVRWMDGANPTSYGWRSFIQVLEHDYVYEKKSGHGHHVHAPNLWSVVHVGLGGGARSCVYMKVYFFARQGGGYVAEVEVWSCGVRPTVPRRRLYGRVDFSAEENAPRKLNREVRRLRELLFQPQ